MLIKQSTQLLPTRTIQAARSNQKLESSRLQSARGKILAMPTKPVPAYTSAKAQAKAKANDRYVNKRMEKELWTYKAEIEKRYQASQLKTYAYPR
jgi:hypothetical protein